jgi:acyl-coenzyme A thioesterase PaaI-like protein
MNRASDGGVVRKEIPSPYVDQQCFFCGDRNEAGLHLRFYLDEATGEVSTEYTASAPFRGLGDILHGGIQCGLFDEVMGWTSHILTGQIGVTSDLTVSFLKPVLLGTPIAVFCRIVDRVGPRVRLEARIEGPDGVVCTRASGTYHLLPQSRFDALAHKQPQT